MYFPLIAILSLAISANEVLCQENTYEDSNKQPWTFVYTLYPFYNSETLLEVWKTDKSADTSANVRTLASDNQGRATSYSDNKSQSNETNLIIPDNIPRFRNEAGNGNGDQLSKNRQQLSNYRNRFKDANLQN